MRWLVDGYNVIRASPDLAARERESLEAGREALCRTLSQVARNRGDQFTVVFDGSGAGGSSAIAGVRVVFSSARESADRVIARMSSQAGAVVSNDREVRRAAARAGAIAVKADEFLARLERQPESSSNSDEEEERDRGARGKKGNPHRLGKKARAQQRALGRLGGSNRHGHR